MLIKRYMMLVICKQATFYKNFLEFFSFSEGQLWRVQVEGCVFEQALRKTGVLETIFRRPPGDFPTKQWWYMLYKHLLITMEGAKCDHFVWQRETYWINRIKQISYLHKEILWYLYCRVLGQSRSICSHKSNDRTSDHISSFSTAYLFLNTFALHFEQAFCCG
jgi:hypothetical protein